MQNFRRVIKVVTTETFFLETESVNVKEYLSGFWADFETNSTRIKV